MAMDPSMQAAAPAPAAPEAPEAPAGFCIELYVGADGKMSVAVEPKEEPVAEEGAEAPSQPVANIQEAMRLIREIIEHDGEMTDPAASQDEMASGYGKEGM